MASDSKYCILGLKKNQLLSFCQLIIQSMNSTFSFTFGSMVSLKICLNGKHALEPNRVFLRVFQLESYKTSQDDKKNKTSIRMKII